MTEPIEHASAPAADGQKVAEPNPVVGSPVAATTPTKSGVTTRGSVYGGRKMSAPQIAVLVLRFMTIVFSLIAFSVMASDSETVDGYEVRFNDDWAAIYLVAMNVIVFVYSIVLLAFSSYMLLVKRSLTNRFILAVIFTLDLIMAFLLMSCSSAAAADFKGSFGPLNSFRSQGRAAIAMSFLAWLTLSLCAIFSGYRTALATRDRT